MVHVLLIEDDGRIRQLVEAGLAARGLSVEAVPDGTSGINALRVRPVDLVLLDLVLPDLVWRPESRRGFGGVRRKARWSRRDR